MAHVFNNARGGHICDRCRVLMCVGTGTYKKLDLSVTRKIIYKKTPRGKVLEFCCVECANLYDNKVKI